MAEDNQDQSAASEVKEIGILQRQLNESLMNAHKIQTSGQGNIHGALTNIEDLYRDVPDNHHLEVGLTPEAFARISEEERFKLLAGSRLDANGLVYFINVAPKVYETLENVSKLNLHVEGHSTDEESTGRIHLGFVSETTKNMYSKTYSPNDFTSFRVVKNEAPIK